MADQLNVKILVDGSQLTAGMRDASATVQAASAQMESAFGAATEGAEKTQFSVTEARHALHGLGEEIGIHVPRFVQSFVSHLGGVGPALAAAFAPIAIIGLTKVLIEAGKSAFEFYENVVNLKSELEALDSIEKKLTDDMLSLSNAIVEGNVKLAELSGGHIAEAKERINALGLQIVDLGKLMDVNGKQFKDLGDTARASLREFLIPTQAKDFDTVLSRVGIEIERVNRLLLNTEEGTSEYKDLAEALRGLSAFYDVLALKVQRYNQLVQIATGEQAKAEKDARDKATKEAERAAKEAERLRHAQALAEIADMERVAKEEIRILTERAKENAEFEKNFAEGLKKRDEDIARLQTKALGEAQKAQEKWLREQDRLLKEAQRPYVELGHAIMRGFDAMVQGVLMGTQTIGQAFSRLGIDMLAVTAEALAKIYLKHLAHWIAVNVLAKAQITQHIGEMIAGATAKKAVEATSNASTISGEAGVAGAAAFASVMEALPFPENVATAPGVMAAAITTTLSNLGLVSAAGGMMSVPRDMLAMVHANESIIPASYAAGLRDLVAGGSTSGAAVHFHIHAIDTQSGLDFIDTKMDHIAHKLRQRTREGR